MNEHEYRTLRRDMELPIDEPDMPDRFDFESHDYEREVNGWR